MYSRREFLERSLKGSSLFAVGAAVPTFVAQAAESAKAGKDRVLVIVQLGGGNDGLNTVVPFADADYQKARPSIGLKKNQVFSVGDGVGLNNALSGLRPLHDTGDLAIVQGVGYPNPNRSHFESMDIWNTADPNRKTKSGWVSRGLSLFKSSPTGIPAFHVGQGELPLALKGAAAGVLSLNTAKPFGLRLDDAYIQNNLRSQRRLEVVEDVEVDATESKNATKGKSPRKALINDVAALAKSQPGGMLDFVRQTSLQTYTSIDRLEELMKEGFSLPDGEYGQLPGGGFGRIKTGLSYELNLVARMIQAGFGTRIFYLALDGFDTHAGQLDDHGKLLRQLGTAIGQFYQRLKPSGDDKRVVLMTFSEFGRRVGENGSKGTDHGSGSNLFVAGPAVKGGLVGKHPSLKADDLDRGDVKFHTDFRQVYATLLDQWLECDSRRVLGGKFEHLGLLERQPASAKNS